MVKMSSTIDTETTAKLVDQVYKNILEKFHPAARHLVAASKSYLKALHGVSAASKTYLEALQQLADLANNTHEGASSDIGNGLVSMVKSLEDIREHESTVLKAFYVDILAPLESNVEKDYKVVQTDCKQFNAQWRSMLENYSRAEADVKKRQRKLKNSKSSIMLDKEIKQIRLCDERKLKYETFIETNLRDVLTQERRRYGFILERQCSLCRHLKSLHTTGDFALNDGKMNQWTVVCNSRDTLSDDVIRKLYSHDRQHKTSVEGSGKEVRFCSGLTKIGRTVSTSELDLLSMSDGPLPNFGAQDIEGVTTRRTGDKHNDEETAEHSAIYTFHANSSNQLSFQHGDAIVTAGAEKNGWRFGRNVVTGESGWFPVAYTKCSENGTVEVQAQTNVDRIPVNTIRLPEERGADDARKTRNDSRRANDRNHSMLSSTLDRQTKIYFSSEPVQKLRTFASDRSRSMASSNPAEGSRTLPAGRQSSVGGAAIGANGANIQRELTSRLQQRKARCSDMMTPISTLPTIPPTNNNELQLSAAQLHSSSDSGFEAESGINTMTSSGVKFNSRGSNTSSHTIAPMRTERGLLILSQANSQQILGDHSSTQDPETKTADEDFNRQTHSLLSHYVTIDRKFRTKKNTLLKFIRKKADDKENSSQDRWMVDARQTLWQFPGNSTNVDRRHNIDVNNVESDENNRSSPRSLSESDLMDIENGDSFVVMKDKEVSTNGRPMNQSNCAPIGATHMTSHIIDQSDSLSEERAKRSCSVDKKQTTYRYSEKESYFTPATGNFKATHQNTSQGEHIATKLKRFNIDPFNYGSYLKQRLRNSNGEDVSLSEGQSEPWSNLW